MNFCSALNHVKLLFHMAACNLSVVTHANQHATALRVGEGADGFGDFVCIVHPQLEILLLVFSLGDHSKHKRHEVKVGRKGGIAYFCGGKTDERHMEGPGGLFFVP